MAKTEGERRKRSAINALKLINEFRAEKGLPKVSNSVKRKVVPKVTRADVARICAEVWQEQYPAALRDANFVLGELTAKLVEQEVARRIQILRGELLPLQRGRR